MAGDSSSFSTFTQSRARAGADLNGGSSSTDKMDAGAANQGEAGDRMSIGSKKVNVALPEIALIAIARVALRVGAGLLLSNALDRSGRVPPGWHCLQSASSRPSRWHCVFARS
jgi:hypothetical protein